MTASCVYLIKLPSIKILLKSLTSNKLILEQKSEYFNSISVFPFSHFIFLLKWNKKEIFNRRHKKDQKQSPQPATLLKRNFCHRCFPVNFAKFLRTPFLTEHLQWLDKYSHVQVAEFQALDTVKSYFRGAFQAFYTATRSSHSKSFIYLK